MSFKLYSIESRKGGVGKTTIAMNLGKQLLKSGPVLLLDCDITGTSISDPASNSVYWKDEANVLKYEDGTPYNLLGYFLDTYVKGGGVTEDFTKEGMLQERKINVIGSQLYAPTSRSIADTRVLMDEIHSFWLMEFVNQLISVFEKKFEEKEVHIIVDNSPGYVGFCQALHQTMLKLGPTRAKYLMVSSIDEQDLKSSIYACSEISNQINDRIKIAQYYKSQIENQQTSADVAVMINEDADLKRFYFSLMEDSRLLESYTEKQFTAKDYLAIVLNKVPRSLDEDNFNYHFENVLKPEEMAIFREITSFKEDKPQTIINYDEAISYQYYWKYLKNTNEEAEKDSYWTRRFRVLSVQNDEIGRQKDRINAIDKQDGIYEALVISLTKHGYSRVAKSLPASWTPSYTYEQLSDLVGRISRRMPLYRGIEVTQTELEQIMVWDEQILANFKMAQPHVFESEELTQLYWKMVEITKEASAEYGLRALVSVSMILYVSLMMLKNEVDDERTGLRSRLVSIMRDERREYAWMKYANQGLLDDMKIDYKFELVSRNFNMFYDRFYRLFCKTLLRMMDMHDDYSILVTAMKRYIPTASPLMFNRELINYLTSVMVTKMVDFDDNELTRLREDAFVMRRVLDVLRDSVLRNWK